MDADFLLLHGVNRIAQLAADLRELEADLPMAEALEIQVAMLERAIATTLPAKRRPPTFHQRNARTKRERLREVLAGSI